MAIGTVAALVMARAMVKAIFLADTLDHTLVDGGIDALFEALSDRDDAVEADVREALGRLETRLSAAPAPVAAFLATVDTAAPGLVQAVADFRFDDDGGELTAVLGHLLEFGDPTVSAPVRKAAEDYLLDSVLHGIAGRAGAATLLLAERRAARTDLLHNPQRRVPPAEQLVGRDGLLVELAAAFDELRVGRRQGPRVVLLHGRGGIGKTAVAECFASEAAGAGYHHVLFLEAGGQAPVTVWARVAAMLGILRGAATPQERAAAGLQELERGRRHLVVVDDPDDVDGVVALCRASVADLDVLVTSRAAGSVADRVVPVPTLAGVEAASLIRHTPDEADAVRALVAFVGGLPKALQLLAGLVKPGEAAALLAELQVEGDFVLAELRPLVRRSLERLAAEGHGAVGLAILYNAAACGPGRLPTELSCAGQHTFSARRGLDLVGTRSLAEVEDVDTLLLHPEVRLTLREDDPELGAAQVRVGAALASLLERRTSVAMPLELVAHVEVLVGAAPLDAATRARLFALLASDHKLRADLQASLAVVERGLALADLPGLGRSRLLLERSVVLGRQGAYSEAEAVLREARAAAAGADDARAAALQCARCDRHGALLRAYRGDRKGALKSLKRLVDRFRGLEAEAEQYRTLRYVANAHSRLGRQREAVELLDEVLVYRRANSPEGDLGILNVRSDRAMSLVRLGRFDQARPELEAVLEAQTLALGGRHPAVGTSHHNLGDLYGNHAKHAKGEDAVTLRGQSIEHYASAADVRAFAEGDQHRRTARSRLWLGRMLVAQADEVGPTDEERARLLRMQAANALLAAVRGFGAHEDEPARVDLATAQEWLGRVRQSAFGPAAPEELYRSAADALHTSRELLEGLESDQREPAARCTMRLAKVLRSWSERDAEPAKQRRRLEVAVDEAAEAAHLFADLRRNAPPWRHGDTGFNRRMGRDASKAWRFKESTLKALEGLGAAG